MSITYPIYAVVNYNELYRGEIGGSTLASVTTPGTSQLPFSSMATAPNGDFYIAESSGYIWRMARGSSNFVADSEEGNWRGITVASNGDVYVINDTNGVLDIYRKPSGGTVYSALGQTDREWNALAADALGNVYAAVWNGSIYKRTSGNFNLHSSIVDFFSDITVSPTNDIYAVSYKNDGVIYKQTNATGSFTSIGVAGKRYTGISAAPDGNIYVSAAAHWDDPGEKIYVLIGGASTLTQVSAQIEQWTSIVVYDYDPLTTPTPTTLSPTTIAPTTIAPTTLTPTTLAPTTLSPTLPPTTLPPTTLLPTTIAPTTIAPTTLAPTTLAPTTLLTTLAPTTVLTTPEPTTLAPTVAPTTLQPTTLAPTTLEPTLPPTTLAPTPAPTTLPEPTVGPTTLPVDYCTDFGEYTSDAVPSDWTERWGTTDHTWLIKDTTTGLLSGKALRSYTNSSSSGRRAITWDSRDAADVDYVFRAKSNQKKSTSGNLLHFGMLARGSGNSGSETCYMCALSASSTQATIDIGKYVSGAFTNLTYANYSWSANTYYWVRFQVTGTTIRVKVWSGDFEDQPVGWTLSTTDSSVSGSGWVGLCTFYGNYTSYNYDLFCNTSDYEPTTTPPTTLEPTTLVPTTLEPTTLGPTTVTLTTPSPTTVLPTTIAPTTVLLTTTAPTTIVPTTISPTTIGPTTPPLLTLAPLTEPPLESISELFLNAYIESEIIIDDNLY